MSTSRTSTKATSAAPSTSAPTLIETMQAFAESMGALISHPQCPSIIASHLTDLYLDIFNEAQDLEPRKVDAVAYKTLLPECMRVLAGRPA